MSSTTKRSKDWDNASGSTLNELSEAEARSDDTAPPRWTPPKDAAISMSTVVQPILESFKNENEFAKAVSQDNETARSFYRDIKLRKYEDGASFAKLCNVSNATQIQEFSFSFPSNTPVRTALNTLSDACRQYYGYVYRVFARPQLGGEQASDIKSPGCPVYLNADFVSGVPSRHSSIAEAAATASVLALKNLLKPLSDAKASGSDD